MENCGPFPQRWFVLSLVDTDQVVMKKKIFKIRQCIFCNLVIIVFLKRLWPFIWTHLNALYPRMHCWKFWVKIGWMVLEKKMFEFHQCIFAILYLSPLKKGRGPLNPFHPRMICAKLSWNWRSGSGEDFLNTSMYFCFFVIISHWNRAGPFIWKNLNPLYPRMICA